MAEPFPERRVGVLQQDRRGPSVGGKAGHAELRQLLPGGDRRRQAPRARLGEGPAAIDEEHLVLPGAVFSEHVTGLDHSGELLVCRRSGRPWRTEPEHTELASGTHGAAALVLDPVHEVIVRVEAHPPRLGRHRPLKDEQGPANLHRVAGLQLDRLTPGEVAPPYACSVGAAQVLDPDAVSEEVKMEMPPRDGLVVEPQVDALAPSNAQRSLFRQEKHLGPVSGEYEQPQPAGRRAGPRSQAQRLRVGVHLDSPTARRYLVVTSEGIARRPTAAQTEHLRPPFPQLVPGRPPPSALVGSQGPQLRSRCLEVAVFQEPAKRVSHRHLERAICVGQFTGCLS